MTDRQIPGCTGPILLAFLWLCVPTPAPGQVDTTVAAGAEYGAGALQRALLGDGYRDTWTATARIPILDLDAFAGGLTPETTGGGVQTTSLRFVGADGREYNFRSVNKSYDASMPDWGRGTLLQWLRKDLTAAQHPAGAVVATELLNTVGILNPGPRLVVMPDDPRLGRHRETFAGMLGTLEVHPNEGDDDEPLFADSRTIAGADRVLEHLDEDPAHRVDARAFLAERLMSYYLNDWDRHVGQYRFARYPDDGGYRWVVIPEDRDYALVDHDGLLLEIARSALSPRLIPFDAEPADPLAMIANSEPLARRLLASVDRATWDSVAVALRDRLTDAAIEGAVAAMPDAWYRESGPEIVRVLKQRRDRFQAMSDAMYGTLAAFPIVRGTEERETAEVERHPDGALTVRLLADAAPGGVLFQRRFVPGETEEVRLFLQAGDDRAVVRGADTDAITVRILGGPDDDVLVDSTGTAVLYDAEGANRLSGVAGTRIDRRPYQAAESPAPLLPSLDRDWGTSGSWFSPEAEWWPDVGLLLGGGPTHTRYGFRHRPFAARHRLTALAAPGHWRGALRYTGELRPESSERSVDLTARASNADILRFHGYGNDSPALPDDSALTWYRRYEAHARWTTPIGAGTEASLGAGLVYSDPEIEAGTRFGQRRPVGADGLGEAAVTAALRHDSREPVAFPRRGLLGGLDARVYAPVEEGLDPYAAATASATAFLPAPLASTLLLEAGGELRTGTVPVHRAAFLGGRSDLRGFPQDRFAGDATAFGTGELRVPLTDVELVARGTLALAGFADAGRVWVDGDSPGGWHSAVGAGLWFTSPLYTLALEYARGENDALYLRLRSGL